MAEQRIHREASTPRPFDRPDRALGGADERLGVRTGGEARRRACRRRARAARPRGCVADRLLERAPTRASPSRSKHASCGLTATQAGPAASIAAQQCAPPPRRCTRRGRRRAATRRPAQSRPARAWPDRGRAQHDLAAALFDERDEPFGEMIPVSLPLSSQAPLTVSLSSAPAKNFGTLLAAIWIRSPVCGLTPWRAPRSATENLPKPVKATSPPRFSVSAIDRRARLYCLLRRPSYFSCARYLIDEFRLCHVLLLLVVSGFAPQPNSASDDRKAFFLLNKRKSAAILRPIWLSGNALKRARNRHLPISSGAA